MEQLTVLTIDVIDRGLNLVLNFEECSRLTCKFHLYEHALEKLAKSLVQRHLKLVPQLLLTRHRLGHNDVRLCDREPLTMRDTEVVVRTLGTHPERERSNL